MGHKRILVVDDDADFRSLVQHVLAEQGYEVLEARTGDEARRLIANSGVELAIVAELLPDGAGTVVIAWLRKTGSRIPVIFVSAFRRDTPGFVKQVPDLNISATLRKPITGAALLSQVTTLVPTWATDQSLDTDLDVSPSAMASERTLSGSWSMVPLTRPESAPHETQELAAQRVLKELYVRTLTEKLKELSHALSEVRAHPADSFALREATKAANRLRTTAANYEFTGIAEVSGRIEETLRLVQSDKTQTGALMSSVAAALRDLRQHAEAAEREFAPARPAPAVRPIAPPPVPDAAPILSPAEQAAQHRASARPQAATPPQRGVPQIALSTSIASPFAEKLLVVDADPEFLKHIKEISRRHMLSAIPVRTTAEAMQAAKLARPDAALIDLDLDSSGADLALMLVTELRALPGLERLPVAFVSKDASMETRITAAQAGASFFMQKPLDGTAFGTAVRQMMSRVQKDRPLILVADSTGAFVPYASALLSQIGMRAQAVADLSQLAEEVAAHSAELIVVDASLKDPTAFDLARTIRMEPRTQDLPIVFLATKTTPQLRIAAYEAGADDILQEPLLAEEFLTRVKLLVERSQLRRNGALIDPVTGLRHRGAFLQELGHLPKSAVALLSVDWLATITMRYGYAVGDQVMAALGRLLRRSFMNDVIRGRWGDDKCVLAFPGEDAETVVAVLTRTLKEFSAQPLKVNDGKTFLATFSAGVVAPAAGDTAENLLRAAEEALSAARTNGQAGQIKAA